METARSLKNILLFSITLAIIPGCGNNNGRGKASEFIQSEAETNLDTLTDVSIYEASLQGQLGIVNKLIDRGTDVNATDKDSRTALMYAAYNGHVEIMKSLLARGALVDLRDVNGTTALMMASSGPYPEAVRLLLSHQADPDLTDNQEHFTALMYAASEGQLEVVRILLAGKADPSLKDIDGDDAKTFAEKNGHPDVAKLLESFRK
jgi:ankyrin repeat protein